MVLFAPVSGTLCVTLEDCLCISDMCVNKLPDKVCHTEVGKLSWIVDGNNVWNLPFILLEIFLR